jgi:hypothetical protein
MFFYTLNQLEIIVCAGWSFDFPKWTSSQFQLLLWFLDRGAGKGAQSNMLADLLPVPHISIGSLQSSYARDESELGVRLTGMMVGTLVLDTLVLDVLATRIHEPDCALRVPRMCSQ